MEKYILYISLALSIGSIIFFFFLNYKQNKLIKKYNFFMKSLGDKDVENLMISYLEDLDKLKYDLYTDMDDRVKIIERKLPNFVKHLAVVNYDAFDNMGNEMSFSIAAMDEKKNGLIITGIYSRENSYVYTKEINQGKVRTDLSIEEKEAMNKALNKFETLKK